MSTYGRQRFTVAYELCHLFFHENFKTITCPKNLDQKTDEQEQEADLFASYFLAPYESLYDFIKNTLCKKKLELTLRDVVKIEQHYGLSRQATLKRLVQEDLLREGG